MANKTEKAKTSKSSKTEEQRANRKARQGKALRENLLKRKAQKRGRLGDG